MRALRGVRSARRRRVQGGVLELRRSPSSSTSSARTSSGSTPSSTLRGRRWLRCPASTATTPDTGWCGFRWARRQKKESSPNYGNKYQIKQKCTVCLRTRGKCSFTKYKYSKCSRDGKGLYICADGVYKYKGVSEDRHCYSWHV